MKAYLAALISFSFIAISSFLLAACQSGSGGTVSDSLRDSFQRDIVEAWYPKSLDKEFGGYLTHLSANWVEEGSQEKFVVTQARHVWTLSQLAMFLEEPKFMDWAEQGFQFLVASFWDEENGGFFQVVNREGRLALDRSKTAYAMSFTIYACASLFEAGGKENALEVAKDAFNWMEVHSWDEKFGGYVNAMSRDGSWISERIGGFDTEFVGAKDYNSSIHMLECLTALYRVWPDEKVEERLEAMLMLVRDRFVQEKGYLHLHFTREWEPLSLRRSGRETILANYYSDHVSWGHDVETAFLILEASHALYREPDAETLRVAKLLVDHALATGWDEHEGSLWEGGYYFEEAGPCELIRADKVWWVAAESLNALLLMAKLFPDERMYRERFEQQWDYIRKNLVDAEYGGWRELGLDSAPEKWDSPKAHRWKASYHDARAYMNCLKMLRGDFSVLQH